MSDESNIQIVKKFSASRCTHESGEGGSGPFRDWCWVLGTPGCVSECL